MPVAAFDDIAGFDDGADQAPRLASFADIAAVEPPASVASFNDILSIEPVAPPRRVPVNTAPTPEEQAIIAASAPAQTRSPFALPATQPTVEPPAPSVFDRLAASAPGRFLEGAAVPVTSIVQRGNEMGRDAAAQIRQGGIAAVPGAVSSIFTGAARDVVAPAGPIATALVGGKPLAAAGTAVDQVIPVTDMARRVREGDYAGAAGELAGTAGLIFGPHAAARVMPEWLKGKPRAEEPPPEVARVAPPAAAEAAPVAPAEAAPVAPPVVEPPTVVEPPKVASVDDIVAIAPPIEEPPHAPVIEAPNALDVREQAPDGARVAHGDTEPEPIAGTGAPPDVRPGEEARPRGPGEAETSAPAPVAPAPTGTAHVDDILEVQPPAEPVTPGKKEPRGVRAEPTELDTLDHPTRREVRRILTELESLPFEKKRFNDAGSGRGGDLEVSGGAGGAPVYWDIVGGNPETASATFRYTRSDVARKLRAFVEDGKRSVVSDLAVDVARRRLEGDRSLSHPSLPPDAGDLPGAIIARRRAGLDPERAAVESRAIEAAAERGPALVDEYVQKFGNHVSADNAKELFPDYQTPELRTANDLAVHHTASAIAQRTFDHLLREPVAEGHDPFVVFTAGGTGSGKTTSLDAAMPGIRERAHVVYDSTLSNFDHAKRNIDAALDAGHAVGVVFTDREVQDAFRATRARQKETGRPVTLESHLATHLKAPEVLEQLRAAYPEGSGVEFYVIRNTGAGREVVGLEDYVPRRYNETDVRAHLERIAAEEAGQAHAPGAGKSPAPEVPRAAAERPGGVQQEPPSGRPPENPRGTREVVDTLDTGEQQPRLPEAGAVRDQNVKTPEFEAPFSLDGGADTTPKEHESDLFGKPREMPDRGRRADTSGALIPSPASRAIAAVSRDKQLRPSEIVREIAQHLDQLPVNVGKFKEHALGIYKPKEQAIRLKVANDLEVFAHELGHHVHESLLGAEIPPKTHRAELEKLGLPTSRPSYSLREKLAEGQAEFTRLYLSDPAAAKQQAPTYYAAFEHALEAHPELAGILQRAQRQYVGHLSLDPVERAMSHLDFDGVDPHPKADVVTRLQTAWVDDLYPLRRMTQDLADNQPINYTEDGYKLARLARGASAKADGFLKHGVRSADGTFIAPALEPALKPVKGQIKQFATYLAALRAVELRGRGMETGMSLADARATVQRLQSPTFDAARAAVYRYQDGLLAYATQEGTLSVDQLKAIKQLNKAYVPFQRVLDDVGAAGDAAGKGGIASKGAPVKRIKGSGRDIVNPLESIVKNTHTLVGLVEQNRAMAALVRQAEGTVGGGRYLEAIPEKQIATSFNLDRLARDIKGELDAAGVDYPDNLDFDKVVTVFTPTQFRMGEKGVVSVLRNGERKWYQVNDQALYDAIATIGPKSSDLLVNLFMKPARFLRAGATTTVGFIARNPIRDNFEAFVNSRYGYKPGYDFVRGLFEMGRKGEDYQNFLNSGAGNAAMVGMDRNRLRAELVKLGAAKRRAFADSVVLNPVNLLQALSEVMEHATRLGEFKRGVETEGRTAEGYARAALAARDVTIDFARGGSLSKEVNRFTAFFNAGVQGTARLAEVFQRDPIGATRRAAAAITVPAVALWAINRDDPTYRELPDWERNTYFHIPLGHGAGHGWIRVPKPFSLGQVFANVPEAALDYLGKKDPEALTRILPDKQTAWKQLISVLPTAFMPLAEVMTNYDTFRDRAIVNPADTNLDTALQYNRWTSDLAKYVGPKIGVAPAKLDHLIYGYGAGLAAGAVQAADMVAGAAGLVAKPKPAGGAGRWPLTGTFYRETPGADARSLEQFYRLRDRVEGAIGSIRRYEKTNEPEAMAARQAQARTDFGPDAGQTLERVRAVDKTLTDIRDTVNQVFASTRLDPDEKKELLDRLYEAMINASRAGLGKPSLPTRFTKPPSESMLDKLAPPKSSPVPARPSAPRPPAAGVGSPASAPGQPH